MFSEKYDEMRIATYKSSSGNSLLMADEFIMPTIQIKYNRVQDYEALMHLSKNNNWTNNLRLNRIMKPFMAVVVTDIHKKIIWVSSYFETMTGYTFDEVIHRKPDFLQGERTGIYALHSIRKKLHQKKGFKGTLINYKKSGEPYDCDVEILPIYDSEGNHVHYIAFETDR